MTLLKPFFFGTLFVPGEIKVKTHSIERIGNMSEEIIKTVIIKAVSDTEFRDLLFDDPDKALADYDLSDDEVSKLKSMKRDKFDANIGELEERISRAGVYYDEFSSFRTFSPSESQGGDAFFDVFFEIDVKS